PRVVDQSRHLRDEPRAVRPRPQGARDVEERPRWDLERDAFEVDDVLRRQGYRFVAVVSARRGARTISHSDPSNGLEVGPLDAPPRRRAGAAQCRTVSGVEDGRRASLLDGQRRSDDPKDSGRDAIPPSTIDQAPQLGPGEVEQPRLSHADDAVLPAGE